MIDLFRHLVVADVEVNQTALGLCAPIVISRHINFTDAVEFLTHAGRRKTDREIKDFRGDFGGHEEVLTERVKKRGRGKSGGQRLHTCNSLNLTGNALKKTGNPIVPANLVASVNHLSVE